MERLRFLEQKCPGACGILSVENNVVLMTAAISLLVKEPIEVLPVHRRVQVQTQNHGQRDEFAQISCYRYCEWHGGS